jgi:hypothetical protein
VWTAAGRPDRPEEGIPEQPENPAVRQGHRPGAVPAGPTAVAACEEVVVKPVRRSLRKEFTILSAPTGVKTVGGDGRPSAARDSPEGSQKIYQQNGCVDETQSFFPIVMTAWGGHRLHVRLLIIVNVRSLFRLVLF